jgi:dTDP-L-rhamnose 4-epimerase
LALIQKDYNVTVLDNLSPQIHGDNAEDNSFLFLKIKNKLTFIKGSVTSKEDWIMALANQHAIIHLAAETGTGQSMYEIEKYSQVNIGGTALMLELLANQEHQVKKIIIASSRSIYGEGKYWSEEINSFVYPKHRTDDFMENGDFEVKYKGVGTPLQLVGTDEESKIHPSSVYGITKQNQEQMVMTVCPTIGIAAVAFRYQNVYGPGQSLSNPYTGILSIFSTLIKNGKDINIFEDGKETRDFVYIDDVVSATILGLEKEEANGEVFNVGTGEATDVITVANELIKNYKANTQVKISGNYRLGDIRHNYADLTKITTKLGYIPKFNFEQGIQQFAKWVSTQEIQESKYDASIAEMKEKGLFK